MALPHLRPDDDDAILTSDAEAWAVFDAEAKRMLGISGDEFLRRWDAGAYADAGDETAQDRKIISMTFLLLAVSPERVDAGRGASSRR